MKMSELEDKQQLIFGSSFLIVALVLFWLSAFAFRSPKEGFSDAWGNTNRVKDILSIYPVSFAPRGWCGRGKGNESYAYGLAWSLISLLLVVACVYLFVATYDEEVVFSKKEVAEIYVGAFFLSASLVYCALFLPIFRIAKS